MLHKIKQHIEQHFPFLEEKKLLIGCSGGLDSVVLSYVLKELGFSMALAHCNFLLRDDESVEDENFVKMLADKLSVPVFAKQFNTISFAKEQQLSTQMAARKLRYDWFEVLRNEQHYDYILTAHHADDDLETFLINLTRGSGLKGLTGIPTVNDTIIRPLLNCAREEILRYAKKKDITWREDSSNAKTNYLRNKLRLDVIPKLKESTSGNLLQQFKKTQSHLLESRQLVEDYIDLIQNLVMHQTKDGISIDIEKLKGLPNTKTVLFELLYPYGFSAWDDISELLNTQTGKQIFSKTHCLLKNRKELLLTEINKEEKLQIFISEKDNELEEPIHLIFLKVKEISNTDKKNIFIDNHKLTYPLILRKWEEGDVFFPFGMKGKKKLSKFFKDEKLSLVAKEKIWVLLSGNDIVWIVGKRSDSRFKIESNTKEIVKITLIE